MSVELQQYLGDAVDMKEGGPVTCGHFQFLHIAGCYYPKNGTVDSFTDE